jgi:hypothetical protein
MRRLIHHAAKTLPSPIKSLGIKEEASMIGYSRLHILLVGEVRDLKTDEEGGRIIIKTRMLSAGCMTRSRR